VNAGPPPLPTAWRPTDVDTPGDRVTVVAYTDLAVPLRALAGGPDLTDVLVAAHVKVLSMLTEDRTFRADVLAAPSGTVHALTVGWEAVATWRQLVTLVRHAVTRLSPPPAPDGALFSTVGWPDRAVAAGYGLRVGARDGALRLEAAAGVVDTDGLHRLAAMYRMVLAAMAHDADGDAVAALLPAGERHDLLDRWAAGPAVGRPPGTVVDLFRAQAARTPDAPAVRVSGATITYGALDEHSNQIAHRLVALGAGPETLVGVCLRRTADLLPALLGVWKSGAAYLPLDADLPRQRLRRMLDAAGCGLVLSTTAEVAALGGDEGGLDDRTAVLLDREREAIAALPRTTPDVRTDPAGLAYVIYTSGSTGTPKGVMVAHGNLTNYLHWTVDAYAAGGSGGSAFFSSIGFDLGIPSLYTPLLVGQRVDLLPDPLDTADLGGLLAGGAPYSFLKLTPGHLNLLSLDLSPRQARDLAGVVIAAGDAFPTALARRWAALAGAGGTAVATEYGPTEITVGNSGQRITDLDADGLTPLGVPIPNTTMYVLTDDLEPAPVGVPGEVYVGGAGVSRGYLGDPALTADRFRPDPYGPAGARLYRTGDRARWRSSGSLEFLGRTDHQVKIRGYRVEPGEIQETLRRHPDVGDAVVVVCDQPPRSPHLAAFVLAVPGRELDLPRLRADLAAELPDHMVPSELVAVGDIPLTANGKVDARALRSLL
jgi:amino acid adenylation domain-containing protein